MKPLLRCLLLIAPVYAAELPKLPARTPEEFQAVLASITVEPRNFHQLQKPSEMDPIGQAQWSFLAVRFDNRYCSYPRRGAFDPAESEYHASTMFHCARKATSKREAVEYLHYAFHLNRDGNLWSESEGKWRRELARDAVTREGGRLTDSSLQFHLAAWIAGLLPSGALNLWVGLAAAMLAFRILQAPLVLNFLSGHERAAVLFWMWIALEAAAFVWLLGDDFAGWRIFYSGSGVSIGWTLLASPVYLIILTVLGVETYESLHSTIPAGCSWVAWIFGLGIITVFSFAFGGIGGVTDDSGDPIGATIYFLFEFGFIVTAVACRRIVKRNTR